ncbi:MAG: RuBisCO large subunit C-terminal-like domain-containing protein [Planctomycetota bacterium]
MTAEPNRIRTTFLLSCENGESAADKARFIALEQTVEIPEGCFSEEIGESVVGQIEEVGAWVDGRARAVISYHPRLVGQELGQLVNLLFGNVSIKEGVQLVDIAWPAEVLKSFRGPALGIPGLRALCAVSDRPLICAVAKPLGLSVEELAHDCREFALGGADIIKDDHSLADQEMAPFRERVERCVSAVAGANAETGGNTHYFPNLFGRPPELRQRLDLIVKLGCRGALVSPMILGLETIRWLTDESGLALLGHPTFSGAFFGKHHGVLPEILLGELFRIAGCDGVIYVNAGGRFGWSQETCDRVTERLRRPLGPILPSFPVPAGGVSVHRVPEWLERYGPDTMMLIGGSLYQQRDLRRATADLVGTATRYAR